MSEEKSGRKFTVKEAEKNLRDLETKDSTLNEIKRVKVFKGTDAFKHLMNKKHFTTAEAIEAMATLLNNHYIVKVRPAGEQYALDISYNFNINHEYIWIVEESSLYTVCVSIGVVACTLIVAMFPIWPRTLKIGTGYLFYLLLILFIFLISTTIIRLVVYTAVKVCTGQSFWIFPNLYEDCGILESFVPLYGWEQAAEGQQTAEAPVAKEDRKVA